jgi:hypothetical protein
MQIEIINVGAPEKAPGKNYKFLEVAYKDNGAVKGKKLMDFANPQVFKDIQEYKQGDMVEVLTVKNDKGYWDWTGFQEGLTPVSATQPNVGGTTEKPKPVSNYETKEERAARQVLIVRQSSLSNAIAFSEGKKVNQADLLQIAEEFAEWVFNEPPKANLDFDGDEDLVF